MNSFIKKANLNGIMPKNVAKNELYSRHKLVAEMLEQRRSLRLIVAPPKYGKKYLAAQYANVVFELNKTWWFDCASPCFLRDLDSSDLQDCLIQAASDIELIIFADVPSLDDQRQKKFFQLIAKAMSLQIETIATTSAKLDLKKVTDLAVHKFEASDLNVTAEEYEKTVHNSNLDSILETSSSFLVASRVWNLGYRNIYLESEKTYDAIETKMTKFLVYLFVKCEMEDIQGCLESIDIFKVCEDIINSCPHIHFDTQARVLHVERESIEDISHVFKTFVNQNFRKLSPEHIDDFYSRLGNKLLESGEAKRSIAFIKTFLRPKCALLWLRQNMDAIIRHGICAEALVMLRELNLRSVDDVISKLFCEFMLFWHTGCYDKCFEIGDSLFRIPSAPLNMQALILSFLSLSCRGDKSFESLANLASLHQSSISSFLSCKDASQFFTTSRIEELANLIEIAYDDQFKALVFLSTIVDKSTNLKDNMEAKRHYHHFLIWAFFQYIVNSNMEDNSNKIPIDRLVSKSGSLVSATTLVKYLADYLNKSSENLPINAKPCVYTLFAVNVAKVALSILDIEFKWNSSSDFKNIQSTFSINNYEDSKHAKYLITIESTGLANSTDAVKDRSRSKSKSEDESGFALPELDVKLFGTVRFKVNNRQVGEIFERRKKSLIIIALLTVNAGKEMTRKEIMFALWEGESANKESNINNFYSLISNINSFFEKEAGCRYIQKSRNGYSIRNECVTSDFAKITDICKSLYYGEFSIYEWREILEVIKDEFSEPFLKQINENGFVERTRASIQTRLVDSLVAGSRKLFMQGELTGCCEFAKEAIEHDCAREDAYSILISALIELEQRAAAIKTYFDCKENLNNILGLDPSNSMQQVYKKVLEM